MCGIAGFAGQEREGMRAWMLLKGMTDAITARGPDEEGHHVSDLAALGARRLSILDVAGGQQPVRGPSGRTVVVYNGELYNYRALRDELLAAGHVLRSEGDTEVIPHLYERYGLHGCVSRLQGMFAFALWDARSRELWLVRDRLGIKPLYWTVQGGELIFGSELKALLQHPSFPDKVDEHAILSYLMLEYVPTPHSIWAGVHKLRPGHALCFRADDGGVREERWWSLSWEGNRPGDPSAWDVGGWQERLAATLEEAVSDRLVSEVPLGTLLSGGLDSSLVSALAARRRPGLRSFSIAFEEPSYDERRFFEATAARLGVEHHVSVFGLDRFGGLFEQVQAAIDEPLADGSLLPTLFLSQEVKAAGVTVVLSGDGADELFAGYPTYLAWLLAEPLGRLPAPLLAGARAFAGALPTRYENVSLDYQARRFTAGLPRRGVARQQAFLGAFLPEDLDRILLPEVRGRAAGVDPLSALSAHWQAGKGAGLLDRVQHLDLFSYCSDDILVKVDRASMAHSLEVRVPFLDHRVVELAAALPARLRFARGRGKALLRRIGRDLLPSEVLTRKKKGFGLPLSPWLRGPLRPLLESALSRENLDLIGMFDVEAVRGLVAEHLDGRADRRRELWSLVVLSTWWRGPWGPASRG